MNIKKIESQEYFRAWAKACCVCCDIKEKVILQDIIGHSSVETLKSLFLNDPEFRRNYLFAIFKTESDDVFFQFVTYHCRQEVDKWIEIEQKNIDEAWACFNDEKRAWVDKEKKAREALLRANEAFNYAKSILNQEG